MTPFSFYGYCRYGDNERRELNDMRKGSPLLCQEWCQKERGCVAFSFDMNARRDCTLYQGGPYTYGWGMNKKNKNVRKCYLMPAKTDRNWRIIKKKKRARFEILFQFNQVLKRSCDIIFFFEIDNHKKFLIGLIANWIFLNKHILVY